MKIEKRGADSYRVRKMYKGKMYTVSFDHKPTQKEAMTAMTDELNKVRTAHTQMTFQRAAESYVDMKRNVLSPRTIKEYSENVNRFPEWFRKLPVSDITQIEVNRLVNEISVGRSPKTVRNYHGFLTAVLGTFYPNLKISTTLPQKVKSEPYTPSQEDVRRILEAVKGTPYEVPIT